MRASDIRGMTREEAELEFVIISQKMDGFGDEYYPAKVSTVNVYYGSNQVSRYQPYRHIISVGQFCQLGNFFFQFATVPDIHHYIEFHHVSSSPNLIDRFLSDKNHVTDIELASVLEVLMCTRTLEGDVLESIAISEMPR